MEGKGLTLKQMQNTVLAVALVTNFVLPFSVSSLNIAVPIIGTEFRSSAASMSWIVASFLICAVALAVPFGRIADIKGRRGILVWGIAIFAIGSVGAGLSPTMALFIASRVAQGLGSAMIFATNIPMLVGMYPPNERGRILGISVAAVYIGVASGPAIGGFLTHAFGWRSVMFVVAAMGLISFAVSVIKIPAKGWAAPDAPREGGPDAGRGGALAESGTDGSGAPREGGPVGSKGGAGEFGIPSILLFSGSMLLMIYGLMTLLQHALSYVSLGVGIAVFVIYIRREAKTDAPIMEMRLFKNPNFLLTNLATLFNYSATFSVAYMLPIYLELVKGFTADITGLIVIAQPIVMTVMSPIAGRMSDRKSPFRLASAGMALCAAALLICVFLQTDSPVPLAIAGLLVLGFGIGLFSSPNQNAAMSCVAPHDFGVANSIQSSMRNLGNVIGTAAITLITTLHVGKTPIDEVPEAGLLTIMRTTFIVFAALCVVGIFVSLQRKPSTAHQ